MEIVSLSGVWENLHTLFSVDPAKTAVIHNLSPANLFIFVGAVKPDDELIIRNNRTGTLVRAGETYLVQPTGETVWVYGNGFISGVEMRDTSVAPYMIADLPNDVWTSSREGFRRLQVDPGQTSFEEGREFRTFYEFSIPTGQSIIIRALANVDTILSDVSLSVDAGGIRLRTIVGLTTGASFTDVLPVITKNTMSTRPTPFYVPVNTIDRTNAITSAGLFTGGIDIDRVRVVTANSSAQQSSVGSRAFDQRGVSVGTYYWVVENISNGTSTGVFSGWWEERP